MKKVKANSGFEVTTTTVIDVNTIASLLCTAFEGGHGTWFKVIDRVEPKNKVVFHLDTDWSKFPLFSYPLGLGGYVTIEDINTKLPYHITRFYIEEGLQIMADRFPFHFEDIVKNNEDALTGDVFLQCCTLGDVLYW